MPPANKLIAYDQRNEPRKVVKYYKNKTSKKEGILFHHTAIRRGFSVAAKKVQKLVLGGLPDERARQLCLGERYMATPYHCVLSQINTVYYNLPFDYISWHGNSSNKRYIGLAWDADSRFDTLNVDQAQEAVYNLVAQARLEGHPISKFSVHSAWTRKPHDPGPEFIQKVMIPLAKELNCHIDYGFKTNKGMSISETLNS